MRRAPTLLAVITACVGLLATPASAERVTGRDDRADVTHWSDDGTPVVPVARPTVDLVGYALRYGRHRISAVLHFRDLRPRGRLSVRVIMTTARGSATEGAFMGVATSRGDRAGTSSADGRGRCRVRHRIDYRRDTVRLGVPASCLGRAPYVDALMLSTVESSKHPGMWTDAAPHAGGVEPVTSLRSVRVRRD